jgi:hypothetical protein
MADGLLSSLVAKARTVYLPGAASAMAPPHATREEARLGVLKPSSVK